jgi:hypothetical protein
MYSIELGDIYAGLFVAGFISSGRRVSDEIIIEASELADRLVQVRNAGRPTPGAAKKGD